MPQGPDGKTIIIVKKVSGHGGHHGGAWKVAYADFVTAMMALFMVLWLVNSASVTTREKIASYFRRPGVFEMGSGNPIEQGGAGILPDAFSPPQEGNAEQDVPTRRTHKLDTEGGLKVEGFSGGQSEGDKGETQEKINFERVAKEIDEAVKKEAALAGLLGKIDVKVDQRGLHLEIMDTPTASMFSRGSSAILGEAEIELKKISKMLLELPNPIDIEGHTDATPFKGQRGRVYDNWDLSTDRANAARRVLVSVGMQESQIARVIGYSSQRLKVKENPMADSNRRISISMRYTDQAAATLKGVGAVETKSLPIIQPKAEPLAVNPVEAAPPLSQPAPEAKLEEHQAQVAPNTPSVDTSVVQSERVDNGKGLQIELQTTLPEGAAVNQTTEEVTSRPVWMEKDKIFGNENPFAK